MTILQMALMLFIFYRALRVPEDRIHEFQPSIVESGVAR